MQEWSSTTARGGAHPPVRLAIQLLNATGLLDGLDGLPVATLLLPTDVALATYILQTRGASGSHVEQLLSGDVSVGKSPALAALQQVAAFHIVPNMLLGESNTEELHLVPL